MAIKTIVNDAKRSLSGLAAMLRYCASPDDLTVALSSFSTDSPCVRKGETTRYELVLASRLSTDAVIRVLIDIYLRANPTHPDGHYAYFEKILLARSRQSETILVAYDWQQAAAFTVDGVTLACDHLWRGDCSAPGQYYVRAVHIASTGKPCQELTLLQELS